VIDPPLTPLDVASGMVLGLDETIAPLEPGTWASARGPLDAMAASILPGLRRPPCMVSFSGGRDSSAILAVACRLARQEGLALPVPATIHFSGAPDADESDWQEQLLKELGVTDWWRDTVTHELELLGTMATTQLRRYGVRYPPNTHFHQPIIEAARGGSLITGAGGDELLSPHEWARVSAVVARAASPRPKDILRLAVAYGPSRMRGFVLAHRSVYDTPWLTKTAFHRLRAEGASWLAGQPVRFDDHLRRWWWRSRYLHAGQSSLELHAMDADVKVISPFMDPGVLDAVAGARLGVGFESRTDAMRWMFGDLLPERVLARKTKAGFDDPLDGPMTREFIERWSGDGGFDPELVDVEALRRQWRAGPADIRSLCLLQSAWLAAQLPSQPPRA
jgi:Asparagine synthase